jgi:thiamine biosynthesis lipoprotein
MLKHRLSLSCIFFFVLAIHTACFNRAEPFRAEFALNTICTIFLYEEAREEVYRDIFNRIREIESRMSSFLPNSDIARINAAAGIMPVQVQDDVFKVIERAVYFAEKSGGAFDPTVGPLVSLWGITGDEPRIPSQEEIDSVLRLVNWRDIELNRERRSVFLKQPGMALDLGGIAKGYAADEAAEIIRRAQLRRGLIDLGGNIITLGVKQDRTPWRVGLQNPTGVRGAYIGVISGWDMTVVTSGVSERYFIADGMRYHHLFSPFTGYPASNGLLAVTVITCVSMDADALSTAVFVLGYEKGRALVDSITDANAIFVFEDLSLRITEGVDFRLTDMDFRILVD